MTTRIMTTPNEKLASEAVTTLDVVSSRAWWTSKLGKFKVDLGRAFKNVRLFDYLRVGPQPMTRAKTAASPPTTTPCIWTSAKLVLAISQALEDVSRWPRLAAVDSREAKVISRFPLSPRSAGTKMKSSSQSRKTFQCWTRSSKRPASTMPSTKWTNAMAVRPRTRRTIHTDILT